MKHRLLSWMLMAAVVALPMALAFVLLGERPSRFQIIGGVIAFAGIGVIAVERLAATALLPLAMTLMAALSWGRANVLTRKAGRVNALAFTVWGSLAAPLPLIGLSLLVEGPDVVLAALAGDQVRAVVTGLPVNMDGSEGPRAQAARAFVRNMARQTDLPFAFWDERLSTVAAERGLLEMDVSRRKRQTRIDSAAAAFILQGVLDRLQALR